MEGKTIGSGLVGAGVGAVQVYALRNYADKPGAALFAPLGDWGQPSAVVDIALGAVSTGLGLWSYKSFNGPIKSKPAASALTGYGLVTLAGGLYSGFKPVGAEVTMAPRRIPEQVPTQIATQVPQRGLTVVPTAREAAQGIVIRSLQT